MDVRKWSLLNMTVNSCCQFHPLSSREKDCKGRMVSFLHHSLLGRLTFTVPWQKVFTPLHEPFERHLRAFEPLKMKPSSQLNRIVLGKVVLDPKDEPFIGLSRGPQSLAVKNKCYSSDERSCPFELFQTRSYHLYTNTYTWPSKLTSINAKKKNCLPMVIFKHDSATLRLFHESCASSTFMVKATSCRQHYHFPCHQNERNCACVCFYLYRKSWLHSMNRLRDTFGH